MEQLRIYFSGIMAGLAIALGGTVYLSVENQIIGALFFYRRSVHSLHDEFSSVYGAGLLSV